MMKTSAPRKILALAIISATGSAAMAQGIPPPPPDRAIGFAVACNSTATTLSPLEAIACSRAALRKKDARMVAMVRQVQAEVSGVDGETGAPIDPMTPDQDAWRKATMAHCNDAACLSAAYDSRIAEIGTRWREALQ